VWKIGELKSITNPDLNDIVWKIGELKCITNPDLKLQLVDGHSKVKGALEQNAEFLLCDSLREKGNH
jgi:hypothetical protein